MKGTESDLEPLRASRFTLRRVLGALLVFGLVLGLIVTGYVSATKPPPIAPWVSEPDAPLGHFEAMSAVIEGDLYRFGGFVEELKVTQAAYRYRHTTRSWERLRDIPIGVTHCNAVVEGPFIWIAGGFVGDDPGVATAEVWRYDSRVDEWSPQVDLPEPRAGGGLVRLDRRLHYFGGFDQDRDTVHGDHFVLDLADPSAWERRAPLPIPRGHLAAAELDGLAYAVGGQLRHDSQPLDLRVVHAYDPEADRWFERASLPSGRSHDEQSILVGKRKLALLGGRDTSSRRNRFLRRRNPWAPLDNVTVYDARVDDWKEVARLPVGLIGASAHLVEGEILLIGGTINGPWEPQRAVHALPASFILED